MAKILIRVVGTLAGTLGLLMLGFAPFMLYQSIKDQNLMMVLFGALPLAVAAYFIYVAYLVWFKLSPLAVRHVCGAIAFYSLTIVTKIFEPSRYSDKRWLAFIFIGCTVAIYIVYRVVSKRLNNSLFPDNDS